MFAHVLKQNSNSEDSLNIELEWKYDLSFSLCFPPSLRFGISHLSPSVSFCLKSILLINSIYRMVLWNSTINGREHWLTFITALTSKVEQLINHKFCESMYELKSKTEDQRSLIMKTKYVVYIRKKRNESMTSMTFEL